jgi:hypothetical protein
MRIAFNFFCLVSLQFLPFVNIRCSFHFLSSSHSPSLSFYPYITHTPPQSRSSHPLFLLTYLPITHPPFLTHTRRENFSDGTQKVLFVVPSEPLVWQVAAFFSQLLRDEGDVTTKVCLILEIFSFSALLILFLSFLNVLLNPI